jgi:sialate O-acetylesterase
MKNGLLILFAFLYVQAFADVRLPALISNGMILQRDARVTIWGWASPGEKISISIERKRYHTITDGSGKWALAIDPVSAGGPHTLSISGHNTIALSDIYFGDVWFCSGQSNMVLTMERVKEKYPDDVANANYPEIRNFFVPTATSLPSPKDDLPGGKWLPLTKENVMGFGAATFFFARKIFQTYHIPIGIINASVGGTPAEAWISKEGLTAYPDYQRQIQKFQDTAYVNQLLKPSLKPVDTTPPEPDRGTSGPVAWSDPSFAPDHWHTFWLPGYWEDQGVKGLNGILWFRKEIEVPASMTGKPAKLFIGRIIDADQTYVNGVPVGAITYQYPPRRYDLPAGLLKTGRNVIVVRVTSTTGKGGFVPDKPYRLVGGNETIDLRGEWLYQIGQVFPPKEGDAEVPFSAQHAPAALYNAMVAPAIPYAIKGFAWYQGETNTGKPGEYAGLLRALIGDWRSKWHEGDLPFLYVQLPNFMEVQYSPAESTWAELRNGQREALDVPCTAMVTTIDLGEWNDVHPLRKKEVGERLASAAFSLAYGDNAAEYSGPLYRSSEVDGNAIVVTFTHTGGGLVAQGGGDLHYFAIAGAGKKYVWAKASIEGNRVRVWSEQVPKPVYVRYAWASNPEGANLYNREGFPASPFETE